MLRGVLTVGGWTMASRVLGFARDILIAAMLGAGPIADAFFVALKLPNLFRRLFGEGAFNAAFVPEFSGLLAAEGPQAARQFATEAFAVMTFWLGALTVVGEVFMPQMMAVLAPGFAAIPEKFALAVDLSRITFPYLLLICLAALVSGVLNGLERFTAASASYVLFNVISIACMLWLTPYVPTAGHALSWGVTASGVAQLALLLWASRRADMPLALPRPRLTPRIRTLMRRMLPGLVGAGVTQLNLTIDVIIASLLPAGTVSLLYYADRVQQLPLGVIGTAVGTALLPLLSRQVRAGEGEAALGTLNRAIEYALFLTLPAALALIVSAYPVMWVLFGRGAFDAESARLSAQSLAAYAVGLPAFVLVKVLAPGFFARGDTATPVKIGIAAVVLNLALNVAFMVPLQHIGPALATSLAAMFNVGGLGVVLARRGLLRLDAQLRRRALRMLLATGAMGVALALAQHVLFATPLHGVARVGALVVLVGTGLVAYGAAAVVFGAGDWRALGRMVGRRMRWGGHAQEAGVGARPVIPVHTEAVMAKQEPPADLLAFTDEVGERGPVRNLTPAQDEKISVLCSLPIPVEHLDAVRQQFAPLFARFKAAAPQGAKLHITEAFKTGNESWRVVAEQVREELISKMHAMRVIVIYVARRARLARLMHENQERLRLDAKALQLSSVKIVGSNRPSDDRIEDDLMINLALMLDTFAEQENRIRVDVMFDEVDAVIADRYEKALEATRNTARNQTPVHGWDPDKQERVSGGIIMSASAPFRLDSRWLGRISVVGKDDPLIFAVDVVANSLWRHLSMLPPVANLNNGPSVAGWPIGELVWGKDHDKIFDLI